MRTSAARLRQVARPNGATTTYTYDGADRLADLSTVVGSTPVSDFVYQTDRLSQRTVVTETLGVSGGGAAPAFASPPLIEDFTFNWSGATDEYSLGYNRLQPTSGGPIVWNTSFGADQEAYVTALDPTSADISLLLKAQGTDDCDFVRVRYSPSWEMVSIWTCAEGIWQQQGDGLPATLQAGDRFGARARADGTLEVYQNTTLIGSVTLDSTWPYRASGGRIGLTAPFADALDDFGGGTLSGSGAFPATAVLDPFTHPWSGDTSNYTVANSALEAKPWPGPITYDTAYGAAQEAAVTFQTIDPDGAEMDLVLKAQGTDECDLLEIAYRPSLGVVQVWTCADDTWQQQGEDLAVTLEDGDRLGAR